jgi:hypothetical protein
LMRRLKNMFLENQYILIFTKIITLVKTVLRLVNQSLVIFEELLPYYAAKLLIHLIILLPYNSQILYCNL